MVLKKKILQKFIVNIFFMLVLTLLHPRYYNSEMGRFITADNFTPGDCFIHKSINKHT
jgi:hypothetical protein